MSVILIDFSVVLACGKYVPNISPHTWKHAGNQPKTTDLPMITFQPCQVFIKKMFLLFGSDGLCFSLYGWWWRWLHPLRPTLLHLLYAIHCHEGPGNNAFKSNFSVQHGQSFQNKRKFIMTSYVSLPWSGGPKSWLPTGMSLEAPLRAPGLAITFQS